MTAGPRAVYRRVPMSVLLALVGVVIALGALALPLAAAHRADVRLLAAARRATARPHVVHRPCPPARGARPKPKRSASVRGCAKPVIKTRRRSAVPRTKPGKAKGSAPPTQAPHPAAKPRAPVPPAVAPAPAPFTAPAPAPPAAAGPTAPQAPQTSQTPPGTAQASAWDEPALINPTIITLSSTNYNLALPQTKDYILQCPNGPIELPSTLSIWGGHNVVLQHCDFEINANWVAYLHNTGATLWVNDVRFGGTNVTGGVQLQEPGATVVMRDVLFDTVHGSYSTNHAELIQTWSGPNRFLIDGLTGSTTYQGLYLLPNQWYTGPAPTQWDFRNIDIDDTNGAYALWVSDQDGAFPLAVQNVYVDPNPARTWRRWWLWGFGGQDSNTEGQGTWANVIAGTPPGGHYVRAVPGGATGVDDGQPILPLAGEQP